MLAIAGQTAGPNLLNFFFKFVFFKLEILFKMGFKIPLGNAGLFILGVLGVLNVLRFHVLY